MSASEFDAAVGQEALEDGATRDGIAKRLSQFRFAGDPRQGLLPESEEVGDNHRRDLLTRRDTGVRALLRMVSSTCQSLAIRSTVSVATFELSETCSS